MPHPIPSSLHRGSLFYIKFLNTNHPPSLLTIYRNYIKSSLKVYRRLNPTIGLYLFNLVGDRRKVLGKEGDRLREMGREVGEMEGMGKGVENKKEKEKEERKGEGKRENGNIGGEGQGGMRMDAGQRITEGVIQENNAHDKVEGQGEDTTSRKSNTLNNNNTTNHPKPTPLFSSLSSSSSSLSSSIQQSPPSPRQPLPLPPHTLNHPQQLKLNLLYRTSTHKFNQFLLSTFQQLHHLSLTASHSVNPHLQPDLRTKHQSKLLYLSFNLSQYFSPSLHPRSHYHSLLLLQDLQDDMEFEVLSDKEKEFVRNLVVKVCGGKKLNHSRYRNPVDYLKDANAVMAQAKKQRLEISKKNKGSNRRIKEEKEKTKLEDQKDKAKELEKGNEEDGGENKELDRRKELIRGGENEDFDEEIDEDEEDDDAQLRVNDDWVLISEKQRDDAVRQILLQQSPKADQSQLSSQSQLSDMNTPNSKKRKQLIPNNSLLFQVLSHIPPAPTTTSTIPPPLPTPQPTSTSPFLLPHQQQLFQIIKRLFKLTTSTSSSPTTKPQPQSPLDSSSQAHSSTITANHLPLLEDMIIEHEFMDEFVNQKRIVIL